MAPADDDRPGPVPALPATSAFGSTSLLMAAIVLVSAVASFGAVRAWFPKAQAAPAVPATARPTSRRRRSVSRRASTCRATSKRRQRLDGCRS